MTVARLNVSSLRPDVEALLVNRLGDKREYFFAPIDVCFHLVGLIRTHWRGLSGGEKVWREVEGFFAHREASSQAPRRRGELAHA